MTDERRARILAIAQELEDQGLEATNSAVYSRALGHRGDVVLAMKARRAERNGGNVAVLEEEEAEEATPTVSEMEEDLQQLVNSYDAWHLALERLWEIEQEGPLSEQHFARKQWLEYNMVQNLQAQAKVQPLLDAARLKEAVYGAGERHDALIPEVMSQAEAVVAALATLTEALTALAAGFEAQSDLFFGFRSRDGQQYFSVIGGQDELMNFMSQLFPSDYRGQDAARLLLTNPVTQGRAQEALTNCPRLHAISPRVLDRYLETMEGYSNGSNS
jgi:hypothetical protein